jgi:hypothetical protein
LTIVAPRTVKLVRSIRLEDPVVRAGLSTNGAYGGRVLNGTCRAGRGSPVVNVVAAQSGYFIIGLTKDDPPKMWRTPVVAWEIGDDLARPLTMEKFGAEDAVLCPEGQIILPGNERYSSEADWFREAIKRRSGVNSLAARAVDLAVNEHAESPIPGADSEADAPEP